MDCYLLTRNNIENSFAEAIWHFESVKYEWEKQCINSEIRENYS